MGLKTDRKREMIDSVVEHPNDARQGHKSGGHSTVVRPSAVQK